MMMTRRYMVHLTYKKIMNSVLVSRYLSTSNDNDEKVQEENKE